MITYFNSLSSVYFYISYILLQYFSECTVWYRCTIIPVGFFFFFFLLNVFWCCYIAFSEHAYNRNLLCLYFLVLNIYKSPCYVKGHRIFKALGAFAKLYFVNMLVYYWQHITVYVYIIPTLILCNFPLEIFSS